MGVNDERPPGFWALRHNVSHWTTQNSLPLKRCRSSVDAGKRADSLSVRTMWDGRGSAPRRDPRFVRGGAEYADRVFMKMFPPPGAEHAFARQAQNCRSTGSAFVASVLEAVDRQLSHGPLSSGLVRGWMGDPAAAAVALRVNGALHALARRGKPQYLATAPSRRRCRRRISSSPTGYGIRPRPTRWRAGPRSCLPSWPWPRNGACPSNCWSSDPVAA